MAIGKCLRCDAIAQMTEDHVLPDWLYKRLENFGVPKPKNNETQLVCAKCNSEKGGKIEFANGPSRQIIKSIIALWMVEIRKYEPQFTI